VGSEQYVAYHDREWGRPQLTDEGIFEHLALESFQSGLSWAVVLRKRPAFQVAFAGFRPEVVAAFGAQDVDRLMANEAIVRNRRKIEAVIHNAGCAQRLIEREGSLAAFFWRYRPVSWRVPRARIDLVSSADPSRALAAELRRLGFRLLGPTTVHAHLQATGLLNDHVAGCCVREDVERQQAEAAVVVLRR